MSAVTILEKLLGSEQSVTSKEHVLDSASRHVSNVESRFIESFDKLVREISSTWGQPQFNSLVEDEPTEEEEEEVTVVDEDAQEQQQTTQSGGGERKRKKLRNVLPPWAKGIATSGGDIRAIRLCYWKRPECIGYVVLRKEMDVKRNLALSYIIALGARRRGPEHSTRSVQTIRQAKEHWSQPILNWFSWLVGR